MNLRKLNFTRINTMIRKHKVLKTAIAMTLKAL